MKKKLAAILFVGSALVATYWALNSTDSITASNSSESSQAKLQRSSFDQQPVQHSQPKGYSAEQTAAPIASTTTNSPLNLHATVSPAELRAMKVAQFRSTEGDSQRHPVKQLLSETWLTPADQPARRRVRIIETEGFKHSYLRLEEIVTTNPTTGDTSINTVKNSVADHLIVAVKDGISPDQASEAFSDAGYKTRRTSSNFLLIEIPNFNDAAAHANEVAKLQTFANLTEFAESDNIRYACVTPNDPLFNTLYGQNNTGQTGGTTDADFDAPEGWELSAPNNHGQGILVCVSDTGVNYLHEDLAPNMWTHPVTGDFGLNSVDNNGDPMDDHGHGTHVAGTIAAKGDNGIGVVGVAWNAQIMACRGLGLQGGTSADLVDGINYARINGANVINASWGGGGANQLTFDAISECDQAGIIFCAAAGNDATDNDILPHFPSNYEIPNLVSVASTDHNNQLSGFSNWGATSVDIAAPGSEINSCWIGGTAEYNSISGTSMATPQICGAIALGYLEFPNTTPAEKLQILFAKSELRNNLIGVISQGSGLDLFKYLKPLVPPENDHLADALDWNQTRHDWTDLLYLATQESGETRKHTAWFKWTAPENGLCALAASSVFRPDIDSNIHGDGSGVVTPPAYFNNIQMKVYKGYPYGNVAKTIESLSTNPLTAINGDFTASKNSVYYITLTSDIDTSMTASLSLFMPLSNDNQLNAAYVSGDSFVANGDNADAGIQSFENIQFVSWKTTEEVYHRGMEPANSVWYRWWAPFTGEMTFQTTGAATVVATYTDTDPNMFGQEGNAQRETWQAVADVGAVDDNGDPIAPLTQTTIQATYGTNYYIVVDGGGGAFTLTGQKPTQTAPTQTFATFAQSQFTTAELADATISADTADADGDGQLNWIEYIHGSNLKDASKIGIISMTGRATNSNISTADVTTASAQAALTAQFTRNLTATGTVRAETSSDMENWTTEGVTESILFLSGNVATVRATVNTGNSQQSFIRLKYTN